jgi:hypothetical protein
LAAFMVPGVKWVVKVQERFYTELKERFGLSA